MALLKRKKNRYYTILNGGYESWVKGDRSGDF
jgi:hypothetical protein